MKSESGQYLITPDELAAFRDQGQPHWWLAVDGATDIYTDTFERSVGWPVYLGSFSAPWFDQWDGDLQRACDEQLNPLLSQAQARLAQLAEEN